MPKLTAIKMYQVQRDFGILKMTGRGTLVKDIALSQDKVINVHSLNGYKKGTNSRLSEKIYRFKIIFSECPYLITQT